MLVVVSVVAVLAFAFVVSQPLFFAFALGRASLALSGPAYAELRQRINAAIGRPLVLAYAFAFVACVALAILASPAGWSTRGIAAGVAAAQLVVDLVIAATRNVPLNTEMNAWDPAALPAQWATKRAQWHRVFAVRQIGLVLAFVVLVVGIVAG